MSNPKEKKKGFKCLVQCLPTECGGNGTSGERKILSLFLLVRNIDGTPFKVAKQIGTSILRVP